MAKKIKNFMKNAIKRPGALTNRAKKNNRSILQQAEHDKKSGTTLQKQQANYYLNVLRKVKR